MSDNNNNKPEKPFVDRRKNRGGITDGGRRSADRKPASGNSRATKIWFGLSMLLTMFIMGWTFSLPFRSEKPVFAWDKSDLPKRPSLMDPAILRHPEHKMSSEEYVANVMELEEELQEQLEELHRVPDDLPGEKHAKRAEKRIKANKETRLKELEKLQKEMKQVDFAEGTVQAQAIERLRNELEEDAS